MKKIILLFVLFAAPFSLLNAQSVDILWQGQTYTPPFYQGRTLWSKQSKIVLQAIPQGLGNPKDLTYKWIQNGTVLGKISGKGKDSIRFEDSILSRSQEIKVQIMSENEDIITESSVIVTPLDSSILVYEDNPLYGYMFNREAGGGYVLKQGEVKISAFPIFAATLTRSNLSYEWRTNGGASQPGYSITYRAPENESGSANVNIEISNSSKILRNIERSLLIQFGEQ